MDSIGVIGKYKIRRFFRATQRFNIPNGIAVTGFWDVKQGVPDPEVYEIDERVVYVRKE